MYADTDADTDMDNANDDDTRRTKHCKGYPLWNYRTRDMKRSFRLQPSIETISFLVHKKKVKRETLSHTELDKKQQKKLSVVFCYSALIL